MKLVYLYIDNVRDNIEAIKEFLKKYSNNTDDFKFEKDSNVNSVHSLDGSCDVYTFFNDREMIYIEDTDRYLVYEFDKKYLEFDVYTMEEFNEKFNIV